MSTFIVVIALLVSIVIVLGGRGVSHNLWWLAAVWVVVGVIICSMKDPEGND